MILTCGASRRIIKENVVPSFASEGKQGGREAGLSLNGGAAALASRVSGYEFVVENSLYSAY